MRLLPLALVFGFAFGFGVGGCSRCARTAAPSGGARTPTNPAAGYDTQSLERSLRPGEKARLLRQLRVGSLAELPLYDLVLQLRPEQASFRGRCTLSYPNRTGQPLPMIPLLLHPNAARELGGAPEGSAELRLTGVKTLVGPAAKLRVERPTLTRVMLERPLAPNEWLQLELRFEGRLRQLPDSANDLFAQGMASMGLLTSGSAASGYGLLGVGDGIAALASAYPMVAPFRRGAFDAAPPPKFGDLAYNTPANFRLRVEVPTGYRVFTSLADAEQDGGKGSESVFVTEGAAVRDLVLVAGRDLTRESVQVGDVTVSSIFRQRDAAAGRRVLETAKGSLELFEQRFGPYPYTELDVAEATLVGGAGGVEFPGMVLIAGMFYRPPSQSSNQLAGLLRSVGGLTGALGGALGGPKAAADQGRAVPSLPPVLGGDLDQLVERLRGFVVAHEVAHQFFAGLVGSDCREHPALDEPLAQFAAGQYMRARYGEEEGGRLFDLNAKANYAVYRMLGPDLPAARPISAFPTAIAYAGIVYGKAPYFYQALRARLGSERFDASLRQASEAQRHRLITLEQWIAALGEAAGDEATVRQLASRYLHDLRGDEDLGVDASGKALFELVLGKQLASQLGESFGLLGLSPKTLLGPLLKRK